MLKYSTNASASVTFEDLKLDVAYKLSHVTQNVESLPPEKLWGFSPKDASLIKYAVPTMTMCMYIII